MITGKTSDNETVKSIKNWLFQPLLSIIGAFLIYQVSEMRTDIKQLLIQSSIDKTRIDDLEREVYKTPKSHIIATTDNNSKYIAWEPTLYLNEEEFNIKKYLISTL